MNKEIEFQLLVDNTTVEEESVNNDVFLIAQTDNDEVYANQNFGNESECDIIWVNQYLDDETVEMYGLSHIDNSYVSGVGQYYRGHNEDLLRFVKDHSE